MSTAEELYGNSEEAGMEPVETVEETTVETTTETTESTGDTSEQSEEPTGETESSSPEESAQTSDTEEGLRQALVAERRRRQEAEDRLKREPEERPDFWENPEAVLANQSQAMQRELQKTKTDLSVSIMRSTHDDYSEMEAVFISHAEHNPALVAQMNQSENPAKFAYDYGKQQSNIQKYSDPNYEENLRSKIRAEIEAENSSRIEAEISKRSSLPGTLANERAEGGNTPAPKGLPTAEDLYG